MVAPEKIHDPRVKGRIDQMRHDTLKKAHSLGVIRVIADYNHLNKQGSPVYDPWETVGPLLFLILSGLGVLLTMGIIMGVAAIIIAMALYVAMVRPIAAKRMQRRAEAFLMTNAYNWVTLWRLGGVVMVRTDRPSVGCVAPRGDWRTFAQHHLADVEALEAEDFEDEIEDGGELEMEPVTRPSRAARRPVEQDILEPERPPVSERQRPDRPARKVRPERPTRPERPARPARAAPDDRAKAPPEPEGLDGDGDDILAELDALADEDLKA